MCQFETLTDTGAKSLKLSSGVPIIRSVESRSARIDCQIAATWRIERFNLGGSATILNLSDAGIGLQLDKEFPVQPGSVIISVRAVHVPELPPEAEIRWFRRLPRKRLEPAKGFVCGAIFLVAPPEVEERWTAWFREAIGRYSAGASRLESGADIRTR